MTSTSTVTYVSPDFEKLSSERSVSIMEIATAPAAELAIRQSGILQVAPTVSRLQILDNAAGGGIVIKKLFSISTKPGIERIEIHATDKVPGMVDRVKARSEQEGWGAKAQVADALDLPFTDSTFDYVFTNFFFQYALPKADDAVRETIRVLKNGGTTAFSVWKEVGWLKAFQEAAPTVTIPPVFTAPSWTTSEPIKAKLVELGLKDVQVDEIRLGTPADDAKSLVAFLREWMPSLIDEQVEKRMVEILEKEYGTGAFELPGWTALVFTGKK
ncbi:S-adenosyl-L-methionine-dependent methyltransferase [Meredithblackwellia eburnea MCA 4105]